MEKELSSLKSANSDKSKSPLKHDIKNHITSIKGYSQLLKKHLEKSKDEKGTAYCSSIEKKIDELIRMINTYF